MAGNLNIHQMKLSFYNKFSIFLNLKKKINAKRKAEKSTVYTQIFYIYIPWIRHKSTGNLLYKSIQVLLNIKCDV